MAPTPETIGPIVPMPNEETHDDANSTDITNQFTNQAFVKDEAIEKQSTNYNTSVDDQSSTLESTPQNLDFDDILPHIGEFGTYQKILFFLMIPFAFSVAFVYFSQIFLTLVPEKHWCRISELEHLTIEQR